MECTFICNVWITCTWQWLILWPSFWLQHGCRIKKRLHAHNVNKKSYGWHYFSVWLWFLKSLTEFISAVQGTPKCDQWMDRQYHFSMGPFRGIKRIISEFCSLIRNLSNVRLPKTSKFSNSLEIHEKQQISFPLNI